VGREVEPDAAISLDDALPVLLAMIGGEKGAQLAGHFLGMIGKATEEDFLRGRLAAIEMEGFEEEVMAAFGSAQADQGGDDGAVAVSPEEGAADAERVEHEQSFFGGATVEVEGQWTREGCGAGVAGAVGNHESDEVGESFDLAVDGVDAVAPAAVQEDERRAAADVAVMNGDGGNAIGVGRGLQFYEGHGMGSSLVNLLKG